MAIDPKKKKVLAKALNKAKDKKKSMTAAEKKDQAEDIKDKDTDETAEGEAPEPTKGPKGFPNLKPFMKKK